MTRFLTMNEKWAVLEGEKIGIAQLSTVLTEG